MNNWNARKRGNDAGFKLTLKENIFVIFSNVVIGNENTHV